MRDAVPYMACASTMAALIDAGYAPPSAGDLTQEQRRFLALHRDGLVTRWQWAFGGAMLRAWCDDGATASITLAGLDDLERAGYVRRYADGAAGVQLI